MLGFVAAYGLLATVVSDSYYQLMLTLVLVWATFGLSWNLLSGYTGLVSFGHAAFFGLGAYTTALGQVHFGLSPYLLIPVAAVIGGASGLARGPADLPPARPLLRARDARLPAGAALRVRVARLPGSQSLPMMRENPAAYMQFADHRIYIYIALALLLAVMLLTRYIERTRFGRALLAIKQNEAAAEAAGIDTYRWKLKAITLSGAVAGAVGAFYAVVLLVVTPVSVFGMLVSAQALVVTMFGGIGTVWGPVIGAAILIPVAETLHAELGSVLPGIQGVIYGAAITAVMLVAPEGVFWNVRDALRRRFGKATATPAAEAPSGNVVRLTPAERSEAQRTAAAHAEVILEAREPVEELRRPQGGRGRRASRCARA